MNVSIIGSFQKYYDDIKDIIILFQKHNINVLSPKISYINSSIDQFVIFESDNPDLSPAEIQTETLNKILKSDIVYVYDPEGYVGRTTCYEIGVLRTTQIPLIFYEFPKDLPIMIPLSDIMSPQKFISEKMDRINKSQIKVDKQRVKNSMILKNILICGSMCFYDKMVEISEKLKKENISVIIPKDESFDKNSISLEEFNIFKKKVSMQYLGKIRDGSTFAILVLNEEKKGIKNYIGANTLVEISMAFCWGRPIFLYNNYYDPLIDELLAWNAKCLNGDLNILIDYYKQSRYKLIDESSIQVEKYIQMNLGDIL